MASAMTGSLVVEEESRSGLGVRGGVGAGVGRPLAITTPGEEGMLAEEEVWSTRGTILGRKEWTAGARMKMALKGSEGLERSGMDKLASNDSSWAGFRQRHKSML